MGKDAHFYGYLRGPRLAMGAAMQSPWEIV